MEGVSGSSTDGFGVFGESETQTGVYGVSKSGDGVYGSSRNGASVKGIGVNGPGGDFGSIDVWGLIAGSDAGKAVHLQGFITIDGGLSIEDGKIITDAQGEIYAHSYKEPKKSSRIEVVSGTTHDNDEYVFSLDSDGSTNFVTMEASASMIAFDVTAQDRFKAVPLFGVGENRLSSGGLEFLDGDRTVVGGWSSITCNLNTTGNLTVGGTKNGVVSAAGYGRRKLYAEEAAEVYFFDRGQGQLVNGRVPVELDPIVLETVTIDDDHPMLVQITLTRVCNGVFIAEKTTAGFTVKELMGGTSNASFDWEVAAKRKGYEDERLELFTSER